MTTNRVQQLCTTLIISLGILTTVCGSTADSFTKDMDKTTEPNVLTVTSNSITIEVQCLQQKTCRGKRMTYKINGDFKLKETTLDPITRIAYLENRTEYVVETTVSINGTEIRKEKMIRTCPDVVPEMAHIRIAKAGPGWIDVRWPTVRDISCKSNIFYLVQYGYNSTGDEVIFSPQRTYGIIRKTNGELIFRPTHPCTAWDEEFCLLLTDYVRPGKNHTVKVKPLRFDVLSPNDVPLPERNEISKIYTTFAYADPRVMGPYTFGQADSKSPCNSLKSSSSTLGELSQVPDEGRGFSQQPITVSVWIIVLAVLLLLSALTVLLVAWIYRKKSKSDRQFFPDECPGTSSPPACSENRYTDRASSVYDDCLSAVNPRSISNLTTTTHQDLVPAERNNVLKSKHPKNTNIETPMKWGNDEKKETITKSSATNHYLTMKPQPIYDDAQGLVRNPSETPYSNIPRDSNMYMEPSSPIYDEAKFVVARESKASEGYNEVYSHSPEKPWQSWF